MALVLKLVDEISFLKDIYKFLKNTAEYLRKSIEEKENKKYLVEKPKPIEEGERSREEVLRIVSDLEAIQDRGRVFIKSSSDNFGISYPGESTLFNLPKTSKVLDFNYFTLSTSFANSGLAEYLKILEEFSKERRNI